MTLWLLLLGVGALVFAWSRSARRARTEWLAALNLLGKWELEVRTDDGEDGAAPPRRTLTMTGTLSSGQYVARDGDVIERGEWAFERPYPYVGGHRRASRWRRTEAL